MQRLLRVFIMNISVCFLEKKRDFHHGSDPFLSSRRTPIQLRCFSASYAALRQLFLLHWRVDHFSCCDKPAVTHQGIMARFICRGDVEKTDTKNVASVSKLSAADHHLLLVVHSIFSCHRVSPDLSAMASPTLVIDPSDVARIVVESTTYGLYGVAANGLT
ncbi:hypothetical protein DAPPUDRAFT_110283 [Daphnia pulex]|uniref:Uncharacterized protein n=1 Tax=Daphnia pulex TaxID=6669 RepID=E9H5K1_DAPPU|nr:hypothetical protein DAPPUDRAFT_110283 [Daphnia pulex]|eukprot:EFX72988.1 hypothetical protein DAPPUDRAFT_110283 [Daphnia pulex]